MVLNAAKLYRFFIRCLVVLLLLASFPVFAQKLKSESYDPSSKKWRIETSAMNLRSSAEANTNVSFVAADTSFLLQLSGSGIGTSTVDMGSELVFLLDNDSTVIARSPAIQGINFENLVSTYRHQYAITPAELRALSRHNVKALRKFSAGGVDLIPIEKKNAAKVKLLSGFFIARLKEKKLFSERPAFVAPGFPGGKEVLVSFLNRNLKQSPDITNGGKKTAVVQFIVAANGTTKDIQIKSPTGSSLDDELIRILQRMPKWKPAYQNGKAVDFVVTQPFTIVKMNNLLRIEF